MIKYRITHTMTNEFKGQVFYVERKGIFKWKKITIKENGESKDLSFHTYVEAEFHIKRNYFKNTGEIYQPRANEYHYRVYSFGY